jgi:hypothetical protein
MRNLLKNQWTIFGSAFITSALTAVLTLARASSMLIFVISAVALAMLAMVVGRATEQLGN